MAAKTFTINALGPTAGQAVDATTTICLLSAADWKGSRVQLEVSQDNVTYAPVIDGTGLDGLGGVIGKYTSAFSVAVPTGWFVRFNAKAYNGAEITAVIE